jgi:hypothetical protein
MVAAQLSKSQDPVKSAFGVRQRRLPADHLQSHHASFPQLLAQLQLGSGLTCRSQVADLTPQTRHPLFNLKGEVKSYWLIHCLGHFSALCIGGIKATVQVMLYFQV